MRSRAVSIRRADQGALEPMAAPSLAVLDALFQSAGRIREPWNIKYGLEGEVINPFQSAGRIREPWNHVAPHHRHTWRCVSIRRADQGALEREPRRAGPPVARRFNPPGGSGSLGTRLARLVGRCGRRFNPPGGSGSLGTSDEDDHVLVTTTVSIRRADQGALERSEPSPLAFPADGFNPPGGSGSLGTPS